MESSARTKLRVRNIAISTFSAFLTRGIGIVVGLATLPLLIAHLGKSDYGFWAVVTSITSWIFLFDFGIVNGLVNAVSEANGRDDPGLAHRYVSSAMSLLLTVTVILAALFAVALPLAPWSQLLGVTNSDGITGVTACVAAAFTPIILGFPFSIARQVWAGYQKAYLANIFAALGSILTLLLTLVGIWIKASLPLFIFLSSSGPLIASIAAAIYLFGVDMPHLRPRLALSDRPAIRRLTSISAPLFLIQLGALFVNGTQMLVLSHRAGLDITAEYSVLMRLYMAPFGLIVLGVSPFIPTFREAAERGDHRWVQRSFLAMYGLRMSAALVGALILVLFGNDILRLWLHENNFMFDTSVWAALALLFVAANHVTAFSDLLTIMDRLWWQVVLVGMNAVSTFALTFALAGKWGTFGAVVASVAFTALVLVWLLPLLALPVLHGRGTSPIDDQ